MIQRRSLLISGATTALGALLSGKATASTRGSTPHLPPLRKGARLRAINPGTWIEPDTAFDALIDRCAAEDWTLEIPPSVTEQWRYFSGRDQERAVELTRAWADPSIDAVISLGGGWGSARVLEAGFEFPRRPKWSLGFSDSCSLLLAQWAAGLPGAIHGSTSGTEDQWQRTVDLLKGRPVAPLDGRGIVPGIGEGFLVVTNLTVGTHLIGTPWMPHLDGTILVLEDVGEAPYRVDRMLTQWRSAGLLDKVAGVACGRFSWMEDDIQPGDFSMEEILENRLGGLGVPLVVNLPIGHGLPNQALPLGQRARLDGRRGRLALLP
ncbi:MAG: LD-carboxypeptidase [Synechococcus sp. cluster2_bin.209]|jgi:muramoyltetrapeptide carboxypeptidase|nr:LD-carboxypeptidase [Synechococcus sp. cluster2_bin.209]